MPYGLFHVKTMVSCKTGTFNVNRYYISNYHCTCTKAHVSDMAGRQKSCHSGYSPPSKEIIAMLSQPYFFKKVSKSVTKNRSNSLQYNDLIPVSGGLRPRLGTLIRYLIKKSSSERYGFSTAY